MRLLGKAMTGCMLAGAVFALGACGSSSSSSSTTSGSSSSSGGSNTIDIYSDLPAQRRGDRADHSGAEW